MNDDTISRQSAIDALNKMKIYRPLDSDRYVISDCLNKIVDLPSAQPERKKGKWEIYVISMFDGEGCRCSECGLEGVPYWDFCPNCGADMREVDDERPD